MAVNLNGIDLSGTAASSTHKASSTQSTPSTTTTAQDATQQPQSDVSITSTASLLAHLQRSLATTPAVDQNRVDAVRNAISAGTYKVNPDKIAHGLINTERALSKLK